MLTHRTEMKGFHSMELTRSMKAAQERDAVNRDFWERKEAERNNFARRDAMLTQKLRTLDDATAWLQKRGFDDAANELISMREIQYVMEDDLSRSVAKERQP